MAVAVEDLSSRSTSASLSPTKYSAEVASEVQVEVEKRKEMEGKYLKARDELHYYKQEWYIFTQRTWRCDPSHTRDVLKGATSPGAPTGTGAPDITLEETACTRAAAQTSTV
jgi:hypothetical protein